MTPASRPDDRARNLPTGRCAGCGAPIPLDPERPLARCGHCGAANLVVGRVTLQVASLRPVVSARDIDAAIGRFARAADLPEPPVAGECAEVWIPFWSAGGNSAMRAAVAVADPALGTIPEPAGDWDPVDEARIDSDSAWEWPSVPGAEGERLRYVPFFRVKLRAGLTEVEAHVNRGTGEVLASRPLNADRLRFGGAMAAVLIAVGAAGVGVGAFAPSPGIGVLAYAAVAAAAAWPLSRFARRTWTPGPGTGAGE